MVNVGEIVPHSEMTKALTFSLLLSINPFITFQLLFVQEMMNAAGPAPSSDSNSGFTNYDIIFPVATFLLIIIIIVACTRIRLAPDWRSSSVRLIAEPDSISIEQAGLDEAALDSYAPKLLYSQVQKGDSSASCCSICLGDYKETDMLRLLPDCAHLFHLKCIDPWIRLHPTCPICRNSPVPAPPTTVITETEVAPLATRQD